MNLGKGLIGRWEKTKDERGIWGFGIAKLMKMYYAYVWNCSKNSFKSDKRCINIVGSRVSIEERRQWKREGNWDPSYARKKLTHIKIVWLFRSVCAWRNIIFEILDLFSEKIEALLI